MNIGYIITCNRFDIQQLAPINIKYKYLMIDASREQTIDDYLNDRLSREDLIAFEKQLFSLIMI